MKGKKEVGSVTSAERGNLITAVACMNATGTRSTINRVPEKKYERGAYRWSTDGLNFGLTSKWMDSD